MMDFSWDTAIVDAINDCRPVSGMSHTFYKYPARFSPLFAREVITTLTRPGDLVFDPFVGGGTSLVEAIAAGRNAIGLDINELAVFVTRVKTRIYSDEQLAAASDCLHTLSRIVLTAGSDGVSSQRDYALNMGNPDTWRIRNFLSLCLNRLQQAKPGLDKDFVRCVLLRTAQWALDCRKESPPLERFRHQLILHGNEAIAGAKELRSGVASCGSGRKRPRMVCLLRSAIGAEQDLRVSRFGTPSLVITSPPYPGVHVLYHRWQVNGRRETAAPYWIASLANGRGASYYTFADRNRTDMAKYLETAGRAFVSVRKLVEGGTPLVQMVAFADPKKQLGPYLEMISTAGWCEMKMRGTASRVWRTVPGRKWYTSVVTSRASRELVLFHIAD
jgi:hypothetical protein